VGVIAGETDAYVVVLDEAPGVDVDGGE